MQQGVKMTQQRAVEILKKFHTNEKNLVCDDPTITTQDIQVIFEHYKALFEISTSISDTEGYKSLDNISFRLSSKGGLKINDFTIEKYIEATQEAARQEAARQQAQQAQQAQEAAQEAAQEVLFNIYRHFDTEDFFKILLQELKKIRLDTHGVKPLTIQQNFQVCEEIIDKLGNVAKKPTIAKKIKDKINKERPEKDYTDMKFAIDFAMPKRRNSFSIPNSMPLSTVAKEIFSIISEKPKGNQSDNRLNSLISFLQNTQRMESIGVAPLGAEVTVENVTADQLKDTIKCIVGGTQVVKINQQIQPFVLLGKAKQIVFEIYSHLFQLKEEEVISFLQNTQRMESIGVAPLRAEVTVENVTADQLKAKIKAILKVADMNMNLDQRIDDLVNKIKQQQQEEDRRQQEEDRRQQEEDRRQQEEDRRQQEEDRRQAAAEAILSDIEKVGSLAALEKLLREHGKMASIKVQDLALYPDSKSLKKKIQEIAAIAKRDISGDFMQKVHVLITNESFTKLYNILKAQLNQPWYKNSNQAYKYMNGQLHNALIDQLTSQLIKARKEKVIQLPDPHITALTKDFATELFSRDDLFKIRRNKGAVAFKILVGVFGVGVVMGAISIALQTFVASIPILAPLVPVITAITTGLATLVASPIALPIVLAGLGIVGIMAITYSICKESKEIKFGVQESLQSFQDKLQTCIAITAQDPNALKDLKMEVAGAIKMTRKEFTNWIRNRDYAAGMQSNQSI